MKLASTPFLLAKKKKKAPSTTFDNIVLKCSKSTTTLRRNHSLINNDNDLVIGGFSPKKRNIFLVFSLSLFQIIQKLNSKSFRDNNTPRISTINSASGSTSSARLKDRCWSGSSLKTHIVVEQDNTNSPNTTSASSFECKVLRSRFVGCGSRSFSRDFFKRISTRFGDCTLRSVESQHEGKPKRTGGGSSAVSNDDEHHHHHCMKERVTYGRLFSGFMMTSSSSSSSSSLYWVSSSSLSSSSYLVITYYCMPSMTSYDLLKKIKVCLLLCFGFYSCLISLILSILFSTIFLLSFYGQDCFSLFTKTPLEKLSILKVCIHSKFDVAS